MTVQRIREATSHPPSANKPTALVPGVWRASETAVLSTPTVATGHPVISEWLPGRGWPLGALIEILYDAPGSGEMSLIAPALAALPNQGPIVLLQPPLVPNALAWQGWQVDTKRLWWVQPRELRDTWWCAEQLLKSGSCAALLCWADPISSSSLRRLHGCAQAANTLFFMFRPASTIQTFSPASLRVRVGTQTGGGCYAELLKSRGPKPHGAVIWQRTAANAFSQVSQTHETLDSTTFNVS